MSAYGCQNDVSGLNASPHASRPSLSLATTDGQPASFSVLDPMPAFLTHVFSINERAAKASTFATR